MGKVTWTKEEENILINHYSEKGSLYCSQFLDKSRTIKAISKKARELGLRKNITWCDNEINLLKNIWQTSKSKDLIKLFPNRTYNSLLQKAVELGLRMEPGFRKRKGDLTFLNTLNSESCYWWGFILADGHLSKSNEISISVHRDDEDHLRIISNKLGVQIKHHKQMCYFMVGDKDFSTKWKKILDMSDECTKTYCPPNITIFKDYFIELFIGLIDGDGHIRFKNGYYNCTIELYKTWFDVLENFKIMLQSLGISSVVKYTKKGKYCRLSIVGKENLNKLVIFTNNLPYMKRKWDKIILS
jgi:hypothetical protein